MNETEALTGTISINGDGLDFGADRAAAALNRIGSAAVKASADSTAALTTAGTEAANFTSKLETALSAATQQFALLTAATDRERQSILTLGVAYDTLTREQQAQVNAITSQVTANKALEAAQNADTASAQRLAAAHRALGEAGNTLTALVTAPIIALGTESVKAELSIDSLRHGLAAVLGSMDAADVELDRIRVIGRGAGLGFEAAAKGVLGLTAAGLTVKQAESAVSGFGKAVAEVGKGKDTFQFVQDELVRLAASSRVSGRSILELSRELPQLRAVLKQSFGTSDPLQLEKLGIDSERMISVVSAAFNKIAIDENSLKNRFDNASDTIQISMAKIGETTAPLAADFLDKLVPSIEAVSNRFAELPDASKDAVLLIVGLAASAGPVAMLANQFVSLSQAAAAAQISLMGPVGLVVALGALGVTLAGLAGANALNDQSDKIMADAGKSTAQTLHERVAKMKADVEILKGTGRDLDGFADKFAAALQGNGLSFSSGPAGIQKKIDELNAAIQRNAALSDRLTKQSEAERAQREKTANGKDSHGFDLKQNASLDNTIKSLQQQIDLFGDESERAKIKWEVFNGALTKADPVLKGQAIALAGSLDALKKAQDAKEEATKREEKFADAVRESNKQLALSRIDKDDPDAVGKKFDIEQEFAKPDERLPSSDAARIRANTVAQASEEATRKTRESVVKSIAEANKKLEQSIQSLREEQMAASLGEQHLTHVQQAQIEIEKIRRDSLGPINEDYVRRRLLIEAQRDAVERDTKSAEANAKAAEKLGKAWADANADSQETVDAFRIASQGLDKHAIILDQLRKKYADLGVASVLLASVMAVLKLRTDQITEANAKTAEAAKAAADSEAERTKRVADGLSELAERYDDVIGQTNYMAESFRKLSLDADKMTTDMYAGLEKYAAAWENLDGIEKQKRQIEDVAQTIDGTLDKAFEATFSRARLSSKTFFETLKADVKNTARSLASSALSKAVGGALMHALGQADPSLDRNSIDTKARSARNDLFEASSALTAAADRLRGAASAVASASGVPGASVGGSLISAIPGVATSAAGGLGVLGGLASALPGLGIFTSALSGLFHLHLAEGIMSVPGSGFADSVPAMLTPREMVLPVDMADSVRTHGFGQGGGDHIEFHGAVFNDAADVHRIRAITTNNRRMKLRVLGA